MWETWVQSLGREDPLKKEMATHSNTLVWKIPCGGEAWYMGSRRVRHDCYRDPLLGSASPSLSAICPLTTVPTLQGDWPTQVSIESFQPLFHSFGGF